MSRAGIFETLVGVVVVAVAAAFLYYAYTVSGRDIDRGGYQISAVFGKADGVSVGSDVRIAGVKIGTVAGNDLNIDTYEANVRLAIADGVPIPEDSIAKIVSDGLLGGAHVAIEPGASEEFLREGEAITITRGSVDLLGLAVQAFTNNASGGDNAESQNGAEPDPLGDL
ncbi:MAG: MlaD family protein [Pseudomonadota bacterium]